MTLRVDVDRRMCIGAATCVLESPATFDVPIVTGREMRWVEMVYVASVGVATESWSGIKTLYD